MALFGPDGRPANQEILVVQIDKVPVPLPDGMKALDALEFRDKFCCVDHEMAPGVMVRLPALQPQDLLVMIETANALKQRDERIEALENRVAELLTAVERLERLNGN